MIKKIAASFLMVLSLSFISTLRVSAQNEVQSQPAQTILAPDYYPQTQTGANFLGQDHSYSVTFRGNGEAVVSARMVFSNLEDSTMREMTLRVPRVSAQDVMVYQISRERQCIRYSPYDPIRTMDPAADGITYQENLRIKPIYPMCLEYQEPDYTQYWYGNNTYNKAEVVQGPDTIVISLPKPVNSNKSGAIIVYYRTNGYTVKNLFGAYNYTFETLKVEDRIRTLQVGISTDSEMILKGAKGNVEYQVANSAPAAELSIADTAGSFKNTRLDSAIQQIGYGTIVKSSSNLQPLDSFVVTGSYAKSSWMLYGRQITMTLLVILIVLILLVLLVRFLIRKFGRKPTSDSKKQTHVSDTMRFALYGGLVSFASAALISGYALIMYFIVSLFESQYFYYSGSYAFFVMILFTVISFAVCALLIFGPALYTGVRFGFWKGAILFGATIIWLKIFLLMLIMILFLFRNQSNYPYPVPMMRGAAESSVDVPLSAGEMMK